MSATDTLDLLADVASSFAKPNPERVRKLRDDGGAVDREMWAKLAENGWLGIAVEEELGDARLDAVAIVARRLGRGMFPEPFVAGGVLAPLALAACGDDRLEAVVEGELLAGVVWHESGRFAGIAGADGYVVAKGSDLLWVEGETGAERRADGTTSAIVTGDGERIGDAADLEPALDAARIAVSAELLGIMDASLDLTFGYLKERKQFGVPIGSFQALQHRSVDIWIQRELASAALDAALGVFRDPESSTRERARAASSAKYRAAYAAPLIVKEGLQLHGAIGYTDEYDLGLYLNRALALAPWLGNAAESRRRWMEHQR